MPTSRFLPVVLCAAFAASASGGDLTITFKTTAGQEVGTSTQYLTADRVMTSEDQTDTIVELATGRIVTIDHKRKQYSEITADELEAIMASMSGKMEEANAQMAEAMKNMPPAMRERMGGMLGGGGEVTVTKGGTREIAGYETEQYTIAMGETVRMEMWTTNALKLPMDPGAFQKLARYANPMLSSPMLKNVGQLVEKMKEVQGYALATRTTLSVMGSSNQTSREATAVATGAIPASTFEIPAGYKKVESPFKKRGT